MTTRVPHNMIGLQPSGGDDRAQIVAALAAGPVYLAPGNWLVSSAITLPSTSYLECAPGATLKPTANSLTLLQTSGFTSGVKLVNVNVDGTGYTGTTAIKFSNVQYGSAIVGANINACAVGIQLDTTCIGVHIDHPTIYGTVDAIKIMASNANVVTCPSIDHQTGLSPLTGTGVYLTGSSNAVYGGFIQGFQHGVYDQGDYNKVDGTYFELCSDNALRWDGSRLPSAVDVFFFGEAASAGARFLCVANDTLGGRMVRPKMVVGNSTGGLFFFSSGNTGCVADFATDGGTTNTALGTTTQITKLANSQAI